MSKQLSYRIAVFVLLISQVGSVTVARADNPLIVAKQASEAASACYLPVIFKTPECLDFFDDFSNPASGWYVGEDNKLLVEYLNGQYRVMVKRTNSSRIIGAPTCNRKDYAVEVDARWAGADYMGVSYGLMFSTKDSPTEYYFFEVLADTREYTVSHYGQGGWELIIEPQFTTAINAGTVSNHLKVTHQGSVFTAYANGHYLDFWSDTTEPGNQGVGLIIYSYPDKEDADARFDNFQVSTISQ